MKTYILLENIIFYAYHGVLKQETTVGNTYTVNLKLATDMSKAFETDSINDTISYAAVYDVVKNEMSIPSQLIEHVANRIVQSLKKTFPEVSGIELKLSKRNPPMGAQLDCASVVLIEGIV